MVFSQKKVRDMVYLALLTALAVVLSIFERSIPMSYIAPGIKLGLANSIALLCLYLYGFRVSFVVFIIRVCLVAVLMGGFSAFLYSFAGGLLSLLAMYICMKLFDRHLSAVGVSLIGSFAHNLGQIAVLVFTTRNVQVGLYWMPILIYAGIGTGFFIGLLVLKLLKYRDIIVG